MKKNFLITGIALFMGLLISDSAPVDMSNLLSDRPIWRLEEMAGNSIPTNLVCYCETAANTGKGFCICKNISDNSGPFVIAIKENNHQFFPK
ncbi:MAG: hypothetical protein ABSF80_04905 [Chitinispirillaceae bacterium]|jgi:hypothetical protein